MGPKRRNPKPSSSKGKGTQEMAEEAALRQKLGNEAFTDGDTKNAIKHYSTAIEISPSSALFSNRSAAYAAIHEYGKALADAKKAVEMSPMWYKGWSRLGKAHGGLLEWEEAVVALEKALELIVEEKGDGKEVEESLDAVEKAKQRRDACSVRFVYSEINGYLRVPDATFFQRKVDDLMGFFMKAIAEKLSEEQTGLPSDLHVLFKPQPTDLEESTLQEFMSRGGWIMVYPDDPARSLSQQVLEYKKKYSSAEYVDKIVQDVCDTGKAKVSRQHLLESDMAEMMAEMMAKMMAPIEKRFSERHQVLTTEIVELKNDIVELKKEVKILKSTMSSIEGVFIRQKEE